MLAVDPRALTGGIRRKAIDQLSSQVGRGYHRIDDQVRGQPKGNPEREARVVKMVETMDAEGFGNCTNTYECEAVCPAEISASFIAKLNREYARASLRRSASVAFGS